MCFSRHVEIFLRDTDIQKRQAQQRRGIPKRIELLVYGTMYDDLKNLISVNKHGLMKNRSTVTNLLEYASFVLNSIEERWQVDSVYTDFRRLLIEYAINCYLMRFLWVSNLLDAYG
jgi:hypothetical protein